MKNFINFLRGLLNAFFGYAMISGGYKGLGDPTTHQLFNLVLIGLGIMLLYIAYTRIFNK